MSVGLDGATVTEVAHRHDVTRQQITPGGKHSRKDYAPPSAGIGKGNARTQRTRSRYLLPRLRW
ncbi:hypothetical protein N8E89_19375 (plasmid) [Phyllobacterium sp. A18/5-2]|nr:hypothetical protein N8E89_19375 [Phyllobacterium sp. A18/5-2]